MKNNISLFVNNDLADCERRKRGQCFHKESLITTTPNKRIKKNMSSLSRMAILSFKQRLLHFNGMKNLRLFSLNLTDIYKLLLYYII